MSLPTISCHSRPSHTTLKHPIPLPTIPCHCQPSHALQERFNAFYSTPTVYTTAKHAANLTWTTKADDFFPIARQPHEIWAGYFTSRPALKGYIRSSSSYLQSCRQLEIQAPSPTNASSFTLWEVDVACLGSMA